MNRSRVAGLAGFAFALAAVFGTQPALADNATKDDAVATVKKGISYIKANGKDKAYAAITAKDPQFVK
eukprot:gene7365-9122_t